MPDLDLIKQGEQGCGTSTGGSPGAGPNCFNFKEKRCCRPAADAAVLDSLYNYLL